MALKITHKYFSKEKKISYFFQLKYLGHSAMLEKVTHGKRLRTSSL
jgi:hypothetical protein